MAEAALELGRIPEERPGPLQWRQHKMSRDLKGISDKGAAGVKQKKPWPKTREAMVMNVGGLEQGVGTY